MLLCQWLNAVPGPQEEMLHTLNWGTYYMWEKRGMCLTGFIIVSVFGIITVVISLSSANYILGNCKSMGHKKQNNLTCKMYYINMENITLVQNYLADVYW